MVRQFILIISLWLAGQTSLWAGQTLILIHGYWSAGEEWRARGIVPALQANGWQDVGHLLPQGPLPGTGGPYPSERYLYTVTLPSEAPIPYQTRWLAGYLNLITNRHPDNDLILLAHSAGGVVARFLMVTTPLSIKGLITIASPHLGTDKAEWGRFLSESPFSWVAPFMGLSTINRSRGLYWDLSREYPGNFLFWLNRIPHPPATYISIVRAREDDFWNAAVPNYSQDLNNVLALRGRAITIPSGGKHALHPFDGPGLAGLLNQYFPHE